MEKGWKFHHIGIVVRDLEKAVENYKALGIVDKISDPFVAEGKKAKLIGCFMRIGSLNIELWEPVRGDTVQQEFLDEFGEGINHVAFTVDDYDSEFKKMFEEKGFPLIFGSKPPIGPRGGGAYFDTRKENHNVIIELISPSPHLGFPDWLA